MLLLFLISYLSKTQYNIIGSALLRCLKLPPTAENLVSINLITYYKIIHFFKFKAIWKDALQTKLKRTRAGHPDNILVQEFRSKYSKLGSGRPVKQKIGEIAERDKHKQVTNN